MIRSLINRYATTYYVQVWEKRLKITNVKTLKVFDEKPLLLLGDTKKKIKVVTAVGNKADQVGAINPFSHPRSLLSDFYVAEKLLAEALRRLAPNRLLSLSPNVVIHPMEKLEGGLTMIEERAFRELCLGAGANLVVVYQGQELSPSQVDVSELSKQAEHRV